MRRKPVCHRNVFERRLTRAENETWITFEFDTLIEMAGKVMKSRLWIDEQKVGSSNEFIKNGAGFKELAVVGYDSRKVIIIVAGTSSKAKVTAIGAKRTGPHIFQAQLFRKTIRTSAAIGQSGECFFKMKTPDRAGCASKAYACHTRPFCLSMTLVKINWPVSLITNFDLF